MGALGGVGELVADAEEFAVEGDVFASVEGGDDLDVFA